VPDAELRRLVLVWLGGGVVLALLQRPLIDRFWVLAVFAEMGYLTLGVALAGYAAWRSLGPAGAPRSTMLLASGAVLGLALAALPLARLGDTITFRTRWRMHRAEYARIVDSVLAAPAPLTSPPRGPGGPTVYYVDRGPPVRLAFVQPGGIVDNWEGLVYDPSGSVAAARGWSHAGGKQEFTAPPAVRGLFGGELVACRHVDGPWYRCWFT
jgi:hypothetical protein